MERKTGKTMPENIIFTTNLKKRKNKKGAVGITSSRKTLIKGVKYQFKARTFYYKKNGRKVYSKWSNIVKIKG